MLALSFGIPLLVATTVWLFLEWREKSRHPSSHRQRSLDRLPFLFLATLASGIVFWSLVNIIPGTALCDAESVLVCFRQWVNAAGALFAVIAASVAAYFAYRQSVEARRQANAAQLLALQPRIRRLSILECAIGDAITFTNSVIEHFKGFSNCVKPLDFMGSKFHLTILNDELSKIAILNNHIEDIDISDLSEYGYDDYGRLIERRVGKIVSDLSPCKTLVGEALASLEPYSFNNVGNSQEKLSLLRMDLGPRMAGPEVLLLDLQKVHASVREQLRELRKLTTGALA
ncbi:hypothetical protein [Phreatobacter sp.]|uniref:hypothetical protein n=1 Tax=Phreatobacter sp. TaxID=1966341 RepID=UPI0025D1CD2C|nr:hypothetical protein [Phreatobacter sp.]